MRTNITKERKSSRLLALLLALAMVVTYMPLISGGVYAENLSGSCGDNVTWTIEDNTLKITCTGTTGTMNDYKNSSRPEWEKRNAWSSVTSIVIGDGVTNVGNWAFYNFNGGTENITNLTLGNSIKTIGTGAFYQCKSIKSITLPDSVESIGFSAFQECESITSITIPASVTSIDYWAFSNCVSLTNVTFEGTVGTNGSGIDKSWGNEFRSVGSQEHPVTLKVPSTWTANLPDETTGNWYGGCFALYKPTPTDANFSYDSKTGVVTASGSDLGTVTTLYNVNGTWTEVKPTTPGVYEVGVVTTGSKTYSAVGTASAPFTAGWKYTYGTIQRITFGGGNVAKIYGDGNYVRTVSGAKTEVRYSSSNPNVAVVDPQSGTVKINNVGTTVITATAKGDDEYTSASDSYTLTVSPKVVNVKADNKTSYVGEDLSPLTYEADELIGDDCFTGNLATTASKNVGGEYKITQGSLAINDGNKGANYAIKFQDGTYTVTDSEAEAGLFVKGTLYNKKAIRITWSEPKDQLTYKVFFTKCNSNKWKCVKTTTTATAYNKKGLKAKTNYKLFVASYNQEGELVEMSPIIHVATGGSKYSNATKVASSMSEAELNVGETAVITAKVAKKSSKKTMLWKNHCAKIRYYSADNDVATVDADGTVTAVGHGIVNIYAVAPSGAYAVTTVKVIND